MATLTSFLDFLTPPARKLYLTDLDMAAELAKAIGTQNLGPVLDDLRALHVIADLNGDLEPKAEYVAELAEMFNHGVTHGIFIRGVLGAAWWRRMTDGRAMLTLHPFSKRPQEEISKIYKMDEAFRDTVCG